MECCRQARRSVGWVPPDPCWSLCIYWPEGARTRMSAGGRGWNASTRLIWYHPGFYFFVLYLPSHTSIMYFFFLSINWFSAADFNASPRLEPLRADLDEKNWKDQEIGSQVVPHMSKNSPNCGRSIGKDAESAKKELKIIVLRRQDNYLWHLWAENIKLSSCWWLNSDDSRRLKFTMRFPVGPKILKLTLCHQNPSCQSPIESSIVVKTVPSKNKTFFRLEIIEFETRPRRYIQFKFAFTLQIDSK